MSETVSIEVLKGRFPSEIINPYGEVLVIPSRLFQPEWESDLEAQGYKVYAGAFSGESTFFVRLEPRKPTNDHNVGVIPKPDSKKGRRKFWTQEEEEKLRELVRQGLSNREIAEILGRTKISVAGKVQRMGLQRFEPARTVTDSNSNLVPSDEDHIRELLEATLRLFPKFPYACRILLSEATSKLKEGFKEPLKS